jgi:hypothetical protein
LVSHGIAGCFEDLLGEYVSPAFIDDDKVGDISEDCRELHVPDVLLLFGRVANFLIDSAAETSG